MQNTKTCPRCSQTLPLEAFNRRAKSPGGYAAACRECTNRQHWLDYNGDPVQNARQRARSIRNRRDRLASDPAYKRAINMWGTVKRRSRIPPWVKITDFIPVCQEAISKGPEYEIDHIIPLRGELISGLHVPGNVRVVPRTVNWAKSNKYSLT